MQGNTAQQTLESLISQISPTPLGDYSFIVQGGWLGVASSLHDEWNIQIHSHDDEPEALSQRRQSLELELREIATRYPALFQEFLESNDPN